MRSPFLVLSLLALLAVPAAAQSFVVTIDEAPLYERSAVDAGVIATVPPDVVAELIGCRASWCEVRLDGVRGFLRQRAVAATDRRPADRMADRPPSPPDERVPTEEIARQEHVDQRGEGISPPAPALEPTAPEQPATASEQTVATPSTTAPSTPVLSPSPPAANPPVSAAPVPTAARGEASAAAAPDRSAVRVAPAPSPATPAGVGLKNPATGTLVSFLLPGGGHLYAGERGVGAALLLLSVAAPTVGYLASDRTADPDCVSPGPEAGWVCTDTTNYGPLLIGIAVASTAWVAGLLDAGSAVRRSNERRNVADVSLRPVTNAQYAGLSLRVSL